MSGITVSETGLHLHTHRAPHNWPCWGYDMIHVQKHNFYSHIVVAYLWHPPKLESLEANAGIKPSRNATGVRLSKIVVLLEHMSWKIAGTIGTRSPKSSAKDVLCAQPKRKSNLQVSGIFYLQAIMIIIATIIIITTSLSLRSCGRCRRWHVRGHPNSILTWRSAPRMFRFPLVLT